MARRKSVAQLQQQLAYAQLLAAATPSQRDESAPVRPRPNVVVRYESVDPMLEETVTFNIQASENGLKFVGNGTVDGSFGVLGISAADNSPTPPEGFKPARLKILVGDDTPEPVRARITGRVYLHYARGNRDSGSQTNYTVPICDGTLAGLRAKVTAAMTAIRPRLGTYGRIQYEPERNLFTA